jgi:hypothetical protein
MGVDKTSVVYRFVVGTSADPHLLRPASTLGYAAPFSPGAISSIRFEIGSGMTPMTGVSVSFFEMAMAPGG